MGKIITVKLTQCKLFKQSLTKPVAKKLLNENVLTLT